MRPYKGRFTAEELRECYVDKKMSLRQIADYYNCDISVIRRAMRREGIPVRDVYERNKLSAEGTWTKIQSAIQRKIDADPNYIPHYKRPRTRKPFEIQKKYNFTYEELYNCYINQEMSTREIGDKFGVSATVIWYTLKRLGIPARKKRGGPPLLTYEDSLESLYIKYTLNAESRNIPFELSIEEFGELVKLPCCYYGLPPSQKRGICLFSGVDRTDSNQGYIKGNVKPCCGTCNRAKLVMSEQQFISWILKAAKHLNSQGGEESCA